MPDTITVASRTPMTVRLMEPLPEEHRGNPGLAPELRSVELNGSNHASAVDGVGYTHGVDASLFHAWFENAKKTGLALAGLVWAHEGDVPTRGLPDPSQYGFEPGIERMKAAEGTPEPTITHEGALTSEEMAAHSDTPSDDSARAEPGNFAGSVQPANEIVAPPDAPEPSPAPEPAQAPLPIAYEDYEALVHPIDHVDHPHD